MTAYPLKDSRQHPRIAGMIVTQPGGIDDDQATLVWPPQYRNADGTATPAEAGNVQFVGPEPEPKPAPEPEPPMATIDAMALGALLLMSAIAAVGSLVWLVSSLQSLNLGA